MGWCFEVAEDVVEEEVWVRVCRVAVSLGRSDGCLAVVEDDDFVDAEDGARAGYLAREGVFHLMCRTAGDVLAFGRIEGYFLICLIDLEHEQLMPLTLR